MASAVNSKQIKMHEMLLYFMHYFLCAIPCSSSKIIQISKSKIIWYKNNLLNLTATLLRCEKGLQKKKLGETGCNM